MQRGLDCASIRKRETIEALRFDDDHRDGLGNNNDVDGHALCEQDNQHWRYELSHAHSRPVGEDVDAERGTDGESGDETGSA